MTKEEIIKETVNEYQDASKRARDGNMCKYMSKDGNMCAVGRCMIPGSILRHEDPDGGCATFEMSELLGSVSKIHNLEEILKPGYRGHEVEFWKNLQHLHDDLTFYTDGKMNDRGREFVAYLIEKWK